MEEIKAIRAELRCREMAYGTYLSWKDCVRFRDTKQRIYHSLKEYELESLEFAVDIVDGKPIWDKTCDVLPPT